MMLLQPPDFNCKCLAGLVGPKRGKAPISGDSLQNLLEYQHTKDQFNMLNLRHILYLEL